jgi:hypothetical protein
MAEIEFASGRVEFMVALKAFTEDAIKELIMPVRMQKGDAEQSYRAADVFLMRLPDSTAATKKAPYVLHQLITAKDEQPTGQKPRASAVVRSICCVYSDDEQEGGLMLLNLMERLRIALLQTTIIGNRFQLDMEAGVECLVYPDDTAPYFVGEMVTNWRVPSIEREVRPWL